MEPNGTKPPQGGMGVPPMKQMMKQMMEKMCCAGQLDAAAMCQGESKKAPAGKTYAAPEVRKRRRRPAKR